MASDFLLSLIDEGTCYERLRALRWPEGMRCPTCEATDYYVDREEAPKLQYRCKRCNRWWTDLTGTMMEGTKLPLKVWFVALDLFRQGRTSLGVAEELGLNRKSTDRIKAALYQDLWVKRIVEPLTGTAEADEVYVNAGQKGDRPSERAPRKRGLKRPGRGTWATDRPPVIGVVSRDQAEVRLEVCTDAQKKPVRRS